MLLTEEEGEMELKKEGKLEKGGEGRKKREDGERLKLFELSPRLPHSFGILLKSGLLFSPA